MHILLTTPYNIWPVSYGGATRTTQLARHLSALGHRITLLSAGPVGPADVLGTNARWQSFPHKNQTGHFWNRGFVKAYTQTLDTDIDLIIAAFPYQTFMLAGPARRAGIPLIYDAHNVEYDRFKSMGNRLKAMLVHVTESHLCRNANAVLTVSMDDQLLMKQTYGRDPLLLPNGVDLQQFSPAPRSGELVSRYALQALRVVLFFGPMDYPPNREALRFLVDQVWPDIMQVRSDTRLLVVGRNIPDWARGRNGTIVAGEVEDIASHIRLADLVVTPIVSGGGTRLKILEALACGQRLISTPFAATGIATEGRDGLILTSRDNFPREILNALDDPMLRPGKEKASRELAKAFDWKVLVASINWPGLTRILNN